MISKEELEYLVRKTVEKLGDKVDPKTVAEIVKAEVEKLESVEKKSEVTVPPEIQNLAQKPVELPRTQQNQERIIISAFGINRPGVVATISSILAKHNVDIVDISQKILQEFYSLIIIGNIAGCDCDFNTLKRELENSASQFGGKVFVQHEEIFRAMHRV